MPPTSHTHACLAAWHLRTSKRCYYDLERQQQPLQRILEEARAFLKQHDRPASKVVKVSKPNLEVLKQVGRQLVC